MPRRFRDFGVAALALAAVLAALTGIDGRVPAKVAQAFSDVLAGRATAPGTAVGDAIVSLAATPAGSNAFVGALLVAAVVLVFLMVRT